MPLSAGEKLGAYEIVAAIGKGGMGEVWRARDPRLGRDVAIKISAQQFTDRFEREARAIAALSELVEAVSQTNGIGAKQQRLGEPPETDASGELLRASVGSARLICFDADTCSWRSITNNFRSVTFVKRPPSAAAAKSGAPRVCAMPARAVVERLEATTVEIVMGSRGDADTGRRSPVDEAELVPADRTSSATAARLV